MVSFSDRSLQQSLLCELIGIFSMSVLILAQMCLLQRSSVHIIKNQLLTTFRWHNRRNVSNLQCSSLEERALTFLSWGLVPQCQGLLPGTCSTVPGILKAMCLAVSDVRVWVLDVALIIWLFTGARTLPGPSCRIAMSFTHWARAAAHPHPSFSKTVLWIYLPCSKTSWE